MRVDEEGEVLQNTFFVSHKDSVVIEYVEKGKKVTGRLEISKITQIEFGNIRGNFVKIAKNKLSEYNTNLCLTLSLNTRTIDIIFFKSFDLKDFCFAIVSLWEGEKEKGEKEY
jgi:hypothetical protein